MTDEQKRELRVKVAELCGWTEHEHERGDGMIVIRWRLNGKYQIDVEPPNYPEDLNAMHEAEKLMNNQQREDCYQLLCWSGKFCAGPNKGIHATATQRAVAFVKVMEGECQNT